MSYGWVICDEWEGAEKGVVVGGRSLGLGRTDGMFLRAGRR